MLHVEGPSQNFILGFSENCSYMKCLFGFSCVRWCMLSSLFHILCTFTTWRCSYGLQIQLRVVQRLVATPQFSPRERIHIPHRWTRFFTIEKPYRRNIPFDCHFHRQNQHQFSPQIVVSATISSGYKIITNTKLSLRAKSRYSSTIGSAILDVFIVKTHASLFLPLLQTPQKPQHIHPAPWCCFPIFIPRRNRIDSPLQSESVRLISVALPQCWTLSRSFRTTSCYFSFQTNTIKEILRTAQLRSLELFAHSAPLPSALWTVVIYSLLVEFKGRQKKTPHSLCARQSKPYCFRFLTDCFWHVFWWNPLFRGIDETPIVYSAGRVIVWLVVVSYTASQQ